MERWLLYSCPFFLGQIPKNAPHLFLISCYPPEEYNQVLHKRDFQAGSRVVDGSPNPKVASWLLHFYLFSLRQIPTKAPCSFLKTVTLKRNTIWPCTSLSSSWMWHTGEPSRAVDGNSDPQYTHNSCIFIFLKSLYPQSFWSWEVLTTFEYFGKYLRYLALAITKFLLTRDFIIL